MNINEINQEISLAVSFKHRGNVKQAIKIEEDCLKKCKREKGTPPYGFVALFKALGKLYYIDNQIRKAEDFYIAALQILYKLIEEILKEGVEKNEFRKMSIVGVTTMLLSMIDGVIWQGVIFRDDKEFNKRKSEAIRAFMNGIKL